MSENKWIIRMTDKEGTEIFPGDIVTADDDFCGLRGVFCGSHDNETAVVAWIGVGLREKTPFRTIRLYAPESRQRPASEYNLGQE